MILTFGGAFHRVHRLALLCFSLIYLSLPALGLSAQIGGFAGNSKNVNETLDRIAQEVDVESVSDKSYADLANIIEQNPGNSRAHLLLGNCYDFLGLPTQAYEEYQLALKYGLNNPKALVGMIKADSKNGRTMVASALIEDGLKRFPDDPEIKFWKGNFLYSKNKYKEAEEMFGQALSAKTKVFGLPSAMALIRFGQMRYLEAISLASQDLVKDPKYVLANQVTGLSFIKLHWFARAVQPMSIAFNAAPLKAIFDQEYADVLCWKGDYALALQPALVYLAVSADVYSQDARAKNLLEQIIRHVSKEDLIKAIDFASPRLGIDKNAAFHFALGDVLDKFDFGDLAIKQYKRGLELEPGFGRGWYHLGLDLERYSNDYAEALRCLKRAAAFSPEDQSISQHLLRLEDRYNDYKSDWAWQIKDWLADAFRWHK